MTESERMLIRLLKTIYDDRDFVNGVMTYADSDIKVDSMIRFINNVSDNSSDILLFALSLECKRDENGELLVDEDGYYINN